MTRHIAYSIIFAAGLAVPLWIGAGYVGVNPLALGIIALIVAFYAAGALEIGRQRRATGGLAQALAGLSGPAEDLVAWLARVPEALRDAVRLRIEGTRAALPGPVLAPYIVGLLVLLGMLGTFLGMIATLRGTGAALESAADLQAMRASLAAPVHGLGFAFGTSVAGVAASAALGLLAALDRRERDQAARQLDACIATSLQAYAPSHQRRQMVDLLQQQAQALPALAERLQAMMDAIERRGQDIDQRLAAGQSAFHDKAEAAYARLAGAMEQSLAEAVAASARSAEAAIRPAVQAAMEGISREAGAWHANVAQAAQQQLEGVAARLDAAAEELAQRWQDLLAEQRQAGREQVEQQAAALQRFADAFEQRSQALLQAVSARLEATAAAMGQAWQQALAEQTRSSEQLATGNRQALGEAVAAFERQAAQWLETLATSQAALQAELAERDDKRLQAWTGTLQTAHALLRDEWLQASRQAADSQREICQALARAADDISAQAEAHAQATIAEIGKLVQAASEAPRAAAEVIAELRQKLSDSLAHDNAVLQERTRLLETVDTLLDSVNHASAEQRAAIDALVATSSDMLARAGDRFVETVQAQADKLDAASAEAAGSVAEIAALAEAFGAAVQAYGQSSDKLVEHLERLGGALERATARSDEQFAYYLEQAREVVDLSLMAQKQIVQDLQQVAARADEAGKA